MKKTILLITIILFSCSLVFAGDITSDRAVREFFKDQTKLRVAGESINTYKEILNDLSLKIIQRAVELAREDKRKTVLKRDIEQASEEILRQAPMTVSELMEKIQQLSIIDLTELTNQVKAYSAELLEKKQ